MATTKSAERRARVSARRNARNTAAKSRIKTLVKGYAGLVQGGKKDEAVQALRKVASALDKAAKTGVIPRARANRRKSRLAARLNTLK